MKRVDSQFHKLAEVSVDKVARGGFATLSDKERVVFCVHSLETEVTTGGFHNYLWGGYGDHALETVATLDKIGAAGTSRLLRQALRVFADGKPPKETFARQREMMRAGPRLTEGMKRLDHQFFEQEENLAGLAMAHILGLP